MKCVRLKAGYRIVCTDSEFAALSLMVRLGREAALSSHNQRDLPRSAVAAIRRPPFTACGGVADVGVLAVTDDRRE